MKQTLLLLIPLIFIACTASKVNQPKCYVENGTVIMYLSDDKIDDYKLLEMECSNY